VPRPGRPGRPREGPWPDRSGRGTWRLQPGSSRRAAPRRLCGTSDVANLAPGPRPSGVPASVAHRGKLRGQAAGPLTEHLRSCIGSRPAAWRTTCGVRRDRWRWSRCTPFRRSALRWRRCTHPALERLAHVSDLESVRSYVTLLAWVRHT